jgi:hypothetical protein
VQACGVRCKWWVGDVLGCGVMCNWWVGDVLACRARCYWWVGDVSIGVILRKNTPIHGEYVWFIHKSMWWWMLYGGLEAGSSQLIDHQQRSITL